MANIYKVPEFYTLANALAAAQPGDIIYIHQDQVISSPIILTKAVHLVGAAPAAGELPGIKIDWGGYNNAVVVVNIPPQGWGDVQTLFIENLQLRSTYTGSDHGQGGVGIRQNFPTNRRMVVNKCVMYGDFRFMYFMHGNNTGEKLFDISFINCWNTYKYGTAGNNDWPNYIPGYQLADDVAAASSITIEKCVVSTWTFNADDLALQAKLGPRWYYDARTHLQDNLGQYGPRFGSPRFQTDFAAPNYAIYGEVTDIPPHVDTSNFEFRLYAEAAPNSNVMLVTPMLRKGFDSVVQQSADPLLYKGYWRFDYLPHGHRYGVLINPADGMQGHWLRWYHPQAIELP